MSTKCTISYSDDYHLYEECLDTNNVYLRLDSGDWDAGLETATIDWHDGDFTKPRLSIRMNVDLWRQIVAGWVESQWGQNPDRDHKKIDFDPSTTLKRLEEYNKNKVQDDASKE